MTAWVIPGQVGDRPEAEGGLILMRGDNMAVASWITRCGGARDQKKACLLENYRAS